MKQIQLNRIEAMLEESLKNDQAIQECIDSMLTQTAKIPVIEETLESLELKMDVVIDAVKGHSADIKTLQASSHSH